MIVPLDLAWERENLMKTDLRSSLLLLLFAFTSAAALAAPTLTGKHLDTSRLSGKYIQKVDYPQINGLPDASVEKHINAILANGSWPQEALEASDIEDGEQLNADVGYAVHLNQRELLSIEYSGLQVLTKGGKMETPHPTKLLKSYTIDLATGHTYTLRELFKAGAPYEATISQCVKKAFGGYDPDESSAANRSYYLTPKSLVLIFPDAPFAVQGAEVEIALKKLASFASPDGPIARLLKP